MQNSYEYLPHNDVTLINTCKSLLSVHIRGLNSNCTMRTMFELERAIDFFRSNETQLTSHHVVGNDLKLGMKPSMDRFDAPVVDILMLKVAIY